MSSSNNQTIEDLCLRFDLKESIKLSANQKYDLISKHNSFTFTSKQTKAILSAVCLYLTVSEDHKPLTITQICSTIGFNINDFGRVYNQVIKDFGHLKNESTSIEQLVEVILKEVDFDPQERQPLIQRVIQLIRIVRQCWLIEGRSPVHIIHGTAFLAWKSLKPSVRTKVKLTEFCFMVSIEYKHTTSKRVNEIFNALKKLGQKIPGKEKFKFSRQNIAIYINDILDYSNSLLYDLSYDVNQQFRAMAGTADNSAFNWINTFKQSCDRNQIKTQSIVEITDTNEEQISDSEIDCYIRNDTEVKKIKKLKKFVENEEKEENQNKEKQMLEKYIKIDEIKF